MSYRISSIDFEDFILSSNECNCWQHNIPNNLGVIKSNKQIIEDNIFMFKTSASINKKLEIKSFSKVSGLCIAINLEDDVIYTDNSNNSKLLFKKDEILIKYVNSYDGSIIFDNFTKTKSLCFVIRDSFLEKYFFNGLNNVKVLKRNFQNHISTNIKKSLASYKTKILANELYNSPFEGDLDTLYLQSKAYEIIYSEFKDIFNLNKENICTCKKVKFNSLDIESLKKAKELILSSQKVYSISDLSKEVALNEFKLKLGFKELFNTTPGSLVLQARMQKAKELLSTGDYNIAEVSSIVGYKHQQSFTVAFTKYFKVNPKELIKNRTYYF